MTEGSHQLVETDRIEILRLILESEQKRSFTYNEAQEVGDSLISFFDILATAEWPGSEELVAQNAMRI
jgi:hypothetical protein